MISVFVTADSVSIVLFPHFVLHHNSYQVYSLCVYGRETEGERERESEHKHMSIYTNAFYIHKILWVRFINNILYNRAKCI